MRYLRLLFILALVFASFHLVYKDPGVSVLAHTYIQEDLKNIIKVAIEDALPDAKNVGFDRMNTEMKNSNTVQANFTYGFTSTSEIGDHRIKIEGTAILNRYQEDAGSGESWSLDAIQLGDETLEFQEPLIIEVDI